jgi:hypothetical protein
MPPPIPQRSWHDWLWPKQNRRWYFTDGQGRDLGEEKLRTLLEGLLDVDETLEQSQDVAQSAVDRAEAADRRATALGGTVAVAATLTVGGASLVLDRTKVPEQGWRFVFALGFAFATLMFASSGFYAARAVVSFRRWAWPYPDQVIERSRTGREDQRLARVAELLHGFAFNWEVADAKIRAVQSSFRAFVVALLLLVALGVGFATYQL